MSLEVYFEGVDPYAFNISCLDFGFNAIADDFDFQLGDVNIIFCSDEYILEMNQKYLSHDYHTDIITFDYSEGLHLSGDLFISLDTVCANASFFGVPDYEELWRVCIHGLLHLCGLNDKTEVEVSQMRNSENLYLGRLENPFVSRET